MHLWLLQLLRDAAMASAATADEALPRFAYGARTALLPAALQAAWIDLGPDPDAETRAFLAGCETSSVFTLAAHGLLRSFLSVTETNAWLGGGRMFVLSTAQARRVLRIADAPDHPPPPLGALLDVGAGDGHVTARLAPLFARVTATEVAPGMVARLRAHGFDAVQTGDLDAAPELRGRRFDVVSLLNVLDRCDRPASLLRQLRSFIVPGTGRLLLALVLPFKPFVEDGAGQRRPAELLNIRALAFEQAVTELVHNVLAPAGYAIVSLARVPYLSERYTATLRPYCWLDDVVVVARPTDAPVPDLRVPGDGPAAYPVDLHSEAKRLSAQ